MRKKLSLLVVLLLVGAYAAYAVSLPKPSVSKESPIKCNKIPTGKVIMMEEAAEVVRNLTIKDALNVIKENALIEQKFKNITPSDTTVIVSLLQVNNKLVTRTITVIPLSEAEKIIMIKDTTHGGKRVLIEREKYVGILLISKNSVKMLYSKNKVGPESSEWSCTNTPCTSDSQCPNGYLCTSACGDECLEWDTVCMYYAGLAHGVFCGACLSGNVASCLVCLLAAGISPWACCEEWEQKCGQRILIPGP